MTDSVKCPYCKAYGYCWWDIKHEIWRCTKCGNTFWSAEREEEEE